MILALQALIALLMFYLGFLVGQIKATKKATDMINGTVTESKQFKN